MKRTVVRAPAIAAVSFVAVFGAGCASTGNMEQLEQMVREAQQTADEALDTARQAEQAANQANTAATNAGRKADQALNTANSASSAANDAQACCSANTERLNRMFEKSMRK